MAGEKIGEVIIEMKGDRPPKMIEVQISADRKGKTVLKEKEKQDGKHQRWLEEVKEDLKNGTTEGAPASASTSECCIFPIPKALLQLKDKDAAYEPQIVCLGPFHFLKHADLAYMEKIKSEVVRSTLAQLNTFNCGEFFSEIVEEINREAAWIKACYDREIQLGDEVLAWMMTRDAIFILQFLRQRLLVPKLQCGDAEFLELLKRMRGGRHFKNDTRGPGRLLRQYLRKEAECATREIESLPLADTLKDIAKLENQIPLRVLRITYKIDGEIVKNIMKKKKTTDTEKWIREVEEYPVDDDLEDIIQSMCRSLSPIGGDNFSLMKERHILECLRSYAVGNVDKQKGAMPDQEMPNYLEALVYHVCQCFLRIIYVIMYPCTCVWKRNNAKPKILPPAVELHKAGLQFKHCHDGIQAISFNERRCTLYLPQIKVDIHTEAIMRNMMAFELCSSTCTDKAVTRYAHLMDQLINTEKDVALLSKYDIISNKLENDSKVADFWNSLTDSTSVPKYEPIDKATEDLKSYYQRRRTTLVILWNEFLEDRCSKPWHVLALVASIIVITVTVSTGFLRILPAIMRPEGKR